MMSRHVGVDTFVNQNVELPHEVRSPAVSGSDHFADTDQIEVRHHAIWPVIHEYSPALTINMPTCLLLNDIQNKRKIN
jgi:hypothetical protein